MGRANIEDRWDLGEHKPEDIFQMAIAIEQGGYDFYSRIIEAADDPRVKTEI